MQNATYPPRITDVPVALLAGGLATRLGTISRQIPKAMVDVNGRPFIDHQLALLHQRGIRQVVMCVGHLGEMIEHHVGDGSRVGMEIRYSHDGPVLAGTGGAIRQALPLLGDRFWVMYGDSYMDIEYADVLASFADSPALGLMAVIQNDDQWDGSNAVFENGRLSCYNKRHRNSKMRHIDYGVQLLRREALQPMMSVERFDLSDLYCDLVSHGQMVGYEVFNRFYEIGTPGALDETRRHLASGSSSRLKASA